MKRKFSSRDFLFFVLGALFMLLVTLFTGFDQSISNFKEGFSEGFKDGLKTGSD